MMKDNGPPRYLNPLQGQFSVAEYSSLTGLDRGLVDLRIHRGLIIPSRIDREAVRRRVSFSIGAVFEAAAVKSLEESVGLTPALAAGAATAIVVIDCGNWMFNAAAHAERGEKLNWYGTAARIKNRWKGYLHFDRDKIRHEFDDEISSVLIPIGKLFYDAYRDCKSVSEGKALPRKRERK